MNNQWGREVSITGIDPGLFVVIPAGCNPYVVAADLVDESVLVGDAVLVQGGGR